MAYKVIILYRLYMPSYVLGTFTEYPKKETALNKQPLSTLIIGRIYYFLKYLLYRPSKPLP